MTSRSTRSGAGSPTAAGGQYQLLDGMDAPLRARGGASPRARSPRSDGASTTAALSFSTAAVSADAALDDADEVEGIAAPGDDEPPPVEEEEEEDILDRLRRGAAAIQARRGADDAADDAVDAPVDEEPAEEAGEEDILDRLRREQAPLQARSPADDAGDALLTVADLGDWSGAADDAAPAQSPRADDAASLSDDDTGASASYSADFLPEPDRAPPRRADDAPPSDDGREETPAQSPRARATTRRLRARVRHAGAAHGRGPRRLVGRRRRRRAGAPAAIVTFRSLGSLGGGRGAGAPLVHRRGRGVDDESSRDNTPATPPRDDSSYEDDFAPDPPPHASPKRTRSRGAPARRASPSARSPRRSTATRTSGFREHRGGQRGRHLRGRLRRRRPRAARRRRLRARRPPRRRLLLVLSRELLRDDERRRDRLGLRLRRPSGDERRSCRAAPSASRPRPSSASSPRRASGSIGADSEYSEDFAEDDAARPTDEAVVLGAQRVVPPRAGGDARRRRRGRGLGGGDAAGARARRGVLRGRFRAPGRAGLRAAPRDRRRAASDWPGPPRAAAAAAARRPRRPDEPQLGGARARAAGARARLPLRAAVAAQLRGERRPRRAAPRAARSRFHATPAALDRVKIKASLALLRTTHDRVNSEALAAFEASLPGGPIREDDPATKQRRLAGRLRADAAQRYVESDEFYARSALLGDGFAMLGESMAEASAEHRRRTEERDASRALSITRNSSSPLDEAVATMDETRENVASYMADVAADPKRAAFRDEVPCACCTAGRAPGLRVGAVPARGDCHRGVCLLIFNHASS